MAKPLREKKEIFPRNHKGGVEKKKGGEKLFARNTRSLQERPRPSEDHLENRLGRKRSVGKKNRGADQVSRPEDLLTILPEYLVPTDNFPTGDEKKRKRAVYNETWA